MLSTKRNDVKRFRNISVVTKCHQRGSKIQASVIIQHDFDTLQVLTTKKLMVVVVVLTTTKHSLILFLLLPLC